MFSSNIILDAPDKEEALFYIVKLKEIFIQLCDDQGIVASDQQRCWNQIVAQHQHSGRAYHNLSHLYSIHQAGNTHPDFPADSKLFYWSLFFHDLIYNPRKKDNEAQSAAAAVTFLTPYLSPEEVAQIAVMIESTAKHQPMNEQWLTRFFLDCDLAILAAPEAVYRRYTKAIREEHKMYPMLLYKHGRRKVLKQFLKRENIYFTSWFHKHGEKAARANMIRELK